MQYAVLRNTPLSQQYLLFHHLATDLNHKNVCAFAIGGQEYFAAIALLLRHSDAVAVVEGCRPIGGGA